MCCQVSGIMGALTLHLQHLRTRSQEEVAQIQAPQLVETKILRVVHVVVGSNKFTGCVYCVCGGGRRQWQTRAGILGLGRRRELKRNKPRFRTGAFDGRRMCRHQLRQRRRPERTAVQKGHVQRQAPAAISVRGRRRMRLQQSHERIYGCCSSRRVVHAAAAAVEC